MSFIVKKKKKIFTFNLKKIPLLILEQKTKQFVKNKKKRRKARRKNELFGEIILVSIFI